MRTKLKATIILASALALSSPAQAAIVDQGTYFQDTVSGQYWLKLTQTSGRSYNDISAKLGYQQEFEGWRYATVTELETLINNFGIPPQGNTCAVGTYCGTVSAAYEADIENLIHLFGDTYDAWLDATNNTTDTAPDGAGKAQGMIGEPYPFASVLRMMTTIIQDREWITRATGLPLIDNPDTIWTDNGVYGQQTTAASIAFGSYLVRDTDPTIPLPPPPTPNPNIVTLFDNLAPAAIGLTTDCPYPYNDGQCGGSNAEGWAGITFEDWGGNLYTAGFHLAVTNTFDAQARPWMRITGFDFTPASAGGGCLPDNLISHSGTRLTIVDIGNNRCRVTIDTDFSFMPLAMSTLNGYNKGYIPGTNIDYSGAAQGPYWSWQLDNVGLEFVSDNITADYKPGNEDNTIRPKSPGWSIYIAIKTTSTAAGDSYDFNAADADPATLRVGTGMATVLTTQSGDIDNDGDIDYIYSFNTGATGITCLDTTITISGKTYSGDPIVGRDSIVPVNCEELVEIDVDPFNAANQVRPNDNYQLTLGIMGSSTASGDAANFDATQVDPATLKFGPGEAPNSNTPIVGDLDGDSNPDLLVGFSMYDSAIACGDTEVQLTGKLYSGLPIVGSDSIETIDCETGGCHP